MYKGQVKIPPLIMQDDTLTISTCGVKTLKMNQFLNTNTNLMGLQFGSDKCVKMHIGKKHNKDICPQIVVDSWTEEIKVNEMNEKYLVDTYKGKELMKEVNEKKYLGDIISNDMKNESNIREKTNKAVGNVNKITSSLHERPYGKHTFRAAVLMRQSMLIGSLLNNAESWINVTESDVNQLEKPDIMLLKNVLSKSGNPSKCFMFLELGVLPVKYVIMSKRLKYLRYILNESITTTLRKVYETLKLDSRKGDFIDLVKKDLQTLEIEESEEEIKSYSEYRWKKLVNKKIKLLAFSNLVKENATKEKTNEIKFDELKLSEYLQKNKNTALSKIIFNIRSGTFDVKSWNLWNYEDNACRVCEMSEENFSHFISCTSYESEAYNTNWKVIFENDLKAQIEIACIAQKRQIEREIRQEESGLSSNYGSNAPVIC